MSDMALVEIAQSNVCAICSKPQTRGYKGKERTSLDIDHCHTTGKIRGLLCNACNRLLAAADDNLEVLRKAISYLESHQS